MRCWKMIFSVVALLALLAGAIAWYYHHRDQQYRNFATRSLDQSIEYIEFQSDLKNESIRIDDAQQIRALKEWIIAAKQPGVGSVPIPQCRLELHLINGAVISMKITPTRASSSSDGAVAQIPDAWIAWDGYVRIGASFPLK